MISALISGKLIVAPTKRVGQSGKEFTTATIAASSGNGEDVMVSVIAFSTDAQAALGALGKGEGVAVTGKATPKVFTGKDGQSKPALDLVVEVVMTPYQLKVKRDKSTGSSNEPQEKKAPRKPPTTTNRTFDHGDGSLPSDIPF